ncbi:MAG TPA: LppX_LprAFG lipoprotein [Herpetosiphonaceae bacterium]
MRRIGRLTLVLVLLLLAACGTPETVDPAKVASEGAVAFDAVSAFHFKLVVSDGDAAPLNDIILVEADGDTARPDKLKAKLKAKLPGVPILSNNNVIIIGADAWVTANPFDPDTYTKQADTAGLAAFSPAKGVSDVLRGLRGAAYVAQEEIGGVQTHHLSGTVDAVTLAALTGGAATAGEVKLDLWIGVEDKLVRQVIAVGALDPSEKPAIKRTLTLSEFNKTVEIAPPQ